jgi:hypothetical protein
LRFAISEIVGEMNAHADRCDNRGVVKRIEQPKLTLRRPVLPLKEKAGISAGQGPSL